MRVTDSLRAPVHSVAEQFKQQQVVTQIADRDRDAAFGLVLMVAGEGNFGKSTLVNALCGREVAPVSAVSLTFKIDLYRKGPFGAVVRREGEEGVAMSWEEAEVASVEGKRAHKLREGAKKGGIELSADDIPLADVVWSRPDLDLPEGCVLVDTPGIAQALNGSARAVTLTPVLGASFEIDAVWAEWVHRADLLVWAFAADKMESEETRRALTKILAACSKPILPVATKIDVIPPEQRDDVQRRFTSVYDPLLKGSDVLPLHLVCLKPGLPEYGLGLPELKRTVAKCVAKGAEERRRAEAEYYRSTAATLSSLLEGSANAYVENLQTISLLGDDLADDVRSVVSAARSRALAQVHQSLHLASQKTALDEGVRRLCQESDYGRASGFDERKIRSRCQTIADSLVDYAEIKHAVVREFNVAAEQLNSIGQRKVQQRMIKEVAVRPGEGVVIHEVPLALNVAAKVDPGSMRVSVDYHVPELGFWAALWGGIVKFFGGEAKKRFTERDVADHIRSALRAPQSLHSEESALLRQFAQRLLAACQEALKSYQRSIGVERNDLLDHIDRALPTLGHEPASRYGPLANYWSDLSSSASKLPVDDLPSRFRGDFLGAGSEAMWKSCASSALVHRHAVQLGNVAHRERSQGSPEAGPRGITFYELRFTFDKESLLERGWREVREHNIEDHASQISRKILTQSRKEVTGIAVAAGVADSPYRVATRLTDVNIDSLIRPQVEKVARKARWQESWALEIGSLGDWTFLKIALPRVVETLDDADRTEATCRRNRLRALLIPSGIGLMTLLLHPSRASLFPWPALILIVAWALLYWRVLSMCEEAQSELETRTVTVRRETENDLTSHIAKMNEETLQRGFASLNRQIQTLNVSIPSAEIRTQLRKAIVVSSEARPLHRLLLDARN